MNKEISALIMTALKLNKTQVHIHGSSLHACFFFFFNRRGGGGGGVCCIERVMKEMAVQYWKITWITGLTGF